MKIHRQKIKCADTFSIPLYSKQFIKLHSQMAATLQSRWQYVSFVHRSSIVLESIRFLCRWDSVNLFWPRIGKGKSAELQAKDAAADRPSSSHRRDCDIEPLSRALFTRRSEGSHPVKKGQWARVTVSNPSDERSLGCRRGSLPVA
mgnify:CR=1 FL=1